MVWIALLIASPLCAHLDPTTSRRAEIGLLPAAERPPGDSTVTITVEGEKRVIAANGLPDHPIGRFPNRANPHAVRSQSYRFTVPANPAPAARPTPLGRRPFGIALNGVLFDPGTAETWQNDPQAGWRYEALKGGVALGLDANHAHVQPNGAYHYHGIPTALVERLSGGEPAMTLVGWAADGFPIYAVWAYLEPEDSLSGVAVMKSSYRLKRGTRPGPEQGGPGGAYDGTFVEDFEYAAGSGDLDECGGRFGTTPEFRQGTYYYVLTEDFPFVPRAFRGTPDPSFTEFRRPR